MGTSLRRPVVVDADTPRSRGWLAPTATLRGEAQCALASPDGYSLWLARGSLDAGASLRWGTDHGDEVLFAQQGDLWVGERTCPEGGAIILEAGVPAEVSAPGGAEVLHFGAHGAQPSDGAAQGVRPGEHVHVVGPGGTWAQVEGSRDTRYFADSTCATCRATLLFTGRADAYESPAHSHSQDELIHILHGELQLGSLTARAGDTLAIAKDVRYKFRSPAPGFGFLNYRRDASLITTDRDAPPVVEGGEVHGFDAVMDLR